MQPASPDTPYLPPAPISVLTLSIPVAMMVPMLAAGLPLATIALATLVVNLRHVFYGLSLLNKLPHQPWARR